MLETRLGAKPCSCGLAIGGEESVGMGCSWQETNCLPSALGSFPCVYHVYCKWKSLKNCREGGETDMLAVPGSSLFSLARNAAAPENLPPPTQGTLKGGKVQAPLAAMVIRQHGREQGCLVQ